MFSILLLVLLGAEDAATPAAEIRGAWNHSGMGAYPGDWEQSCGVLKENGFTRVFPNMLWGGLAHYASDVLPRSETFQKRGDQIEQCVAAAAKHGVEVHVWKVNFNLSTAPPDFVKKMQGAGRTQQNVSGAPHKWLCPSHPENQNLERESMLEVVRKYPVHGIHFDYIRYPGREFCYCPGCRERLEAASGRKVENWPADCFTGPRKEEYNDWRCRQITELVAAVSREARAIRPNIKVSAAVFGGYPSCRNSVAQDWPKWIAAGHLDFVCPMNYATDPAYFERLLTNQLRLAEGKIPVFPGIGASATKPPLTAAQVAQQARRARTLGAAGFTLFEFNAKTAEQLLPELKKELKK